MNSNIRILLADDDAVIRENLPPLLNNQEGIEVVAIARDGAEALTLMGQHAIDVALLDVDMPLLDGPETAAAILRSFPQANIVMLTAFEREDMLGEALSAGARGFLTKDMAPEELAESIRKAARGEKVMAPRPFELLTANYLATTEDRSKYKSFIDGVSQLPEHLRPIFGHLAQAKSNQEISRATGLSANTVRSYVSDVFDLVGVHNRGRLGITAVKAGINFADYLED